MPDIIVRNEGTIWTFEPVTDQAKDWIAQEIEIESWQWMGPMFAVDHRMAQDLVGVLQEIGFEMERR